MNPPDLEQALDMIFSRLPGHRTEDVEILESLGRVLAADVIAGSDQPSADRSIVDGYAFSSGSGKAASVSNPLVLQVAYRLSAGDNAGPRLEPGCCAEVCTGSALPVGADTVVPVESVKVEGERVIVNQPFARAAHIRSKGDFFRKGDLLAPAGRVIRPEEVHVLASVGYSRVSTVAPPRVSIVSTGSELVDVGQSASEGQLFASNLYYLASYARLAGAVIRDLDIVPDNAERIADAITQSKSEVVVTTGGTARGFHDLLRTVLDRIGAEILVDGVSMSPGRSFMFAVAASGKPVFCFPGSPGASRALAWVLLNPVLRGMAGHADWRPPEIAAILEEDIPTRRGLAKYIPCRVSRIPAGLSVRIVPSGGRDIYYPSMEVNGFLVIPADVDFLKSGYEVRVVLTGKPDFVAEDEIL